MVQLVIFVFIMVPKWYTFSRNYTVSFEFLSSPGYQHVVKYSLMTPHSSISQTATWLQGESKHTTLFFTVCTVLNALHEFLNTNTFCWSSQVAQIAKESVHNAGDLGSISGSGRSPGEGHDNPLLYSCLENPMDREAWQAIVHRVAKCWTRLSN